MKRAIALAGGGPACGLQIGALQRLAKAGISFDVWALSCIGAWVGVVYNQFEPELAPDATAKFFHDNVFRDDLSYSRFPINHAFAPDIVNNLTALTAFLSNPDSYRNLVLPEAMLAVAQRNLQFLADARQWNQGDFNGLILENMAAHPLSRFLTSLIYLSPISGLSRIYYPKGQFLQSIRFENLEKPDRPFIYHNAWNLDRDRLELFANRPRPGYGKLTPASLCACSALPYVEETVQIDGETYCEGALVDTVNFRDLLEDNPDLDEVWIARIVATSQIREPKDLTDALGNLCMLFAASVGEDDVKLFRFHAQERGWQGRIVEIPVSAKIDFDWSRSNLAHGIAAGYAAADETLRRYREKPAA